MNRYHALFIALLIALICIAATMTEKSFRGTGGITVSSNLNTHIITIDGSGISGGSITTNGNQFLGVPLSIRDGVKLTNQQTGTIRDDNGTNRFEFAAGATRFRDGNGASRIQIDAGGVTKLQGTNGSVFVQFSQDGIGDYQQPWTFDSWLNVTGAQTNAGGLWLTIGQFTGNGAGLTNLNGLSSASNSGPFSVYGTAGVAGSETLFDTNNHPYVISVADNSSNIVRRLETNAAPGVRVVSVTSSSNEVDAILTGTVGQVPTFMADGTLSSSNPATGGSQTPWSSDINGSGFSLSNAFKVSLGTNGYSGTQNPSFIMGGTNLAGVGVMFKEAETNNSLEWRGGTGTTYSASVAMSLTPAGVLTANGSITAAGTVNAGTSITLGGTAQISWNNRSLLSSAVDGELTLWNSGASTFTRLDFGGTTAAFPSFGRTNGVLTLIGGGGLFGGGNTNGFILEGGLNVGTTNFPAVRAFTLGPNGAAITNILTFSATLDFPSTAAGGVSDLTITATGVSDGDVVQLGVPSASVGPLTGDFFAWASNAVVYVRFANNNLVTAQDPASGTFKVIVTKF